MKQQLTGNYKFVPTWFGVVLWVEYIQVEWDIDCSTYETTGWRKAKGHDLAFINLKN